MVKRREAEAFHRALQEAGHFAWRTCVSCPQPFKGRWDEAMLDRWVEFSGPTSVQVMEEWRSISTKRCKKCNQENHRFIRFRNWFDILRGHLQIDPELKVALVTLTKGTSHLRNSEASPTVLAGMDSLRSMKKKGSRMIRENPVWKKHFLGGLVVGEMKFRRPRDIVKDRKTGEILRICKEFEAHPHIHAVLLYKKKLPFKKLIEASQKGTFESCWIDADVSLQRTQNYLRGYLMKDDPRLKGKTMRCRDKIGIMKKDPEIVVPIWAWRAMETTNVKLKWKWERKFLTPEIIPKKQSEQAFSD